MPNQPTFKQKLYDILYTPMDIAGLAVLRMLFGIIIMTEAWRYTDLMRIVAKFTRQDFYFKFRYFEWVEPISAYQMRWMFIAYFVSGALIFLGVFYRTAIITAIACISYIFLVDATNYLNHFYLIIIFTGLMFFVPAHRGWSIHALIFKRSALKTVPGWAIWLIRSELALVYFYAAVAKMNVDWINGMPIYKWIGERPENAGFEQFLSSTAAVYGFTYGGLLFDLIIAPALLYKRTRAMAFCLALSFHLTNYYIFNIGIFPWFMIAATTIFFEADWPRKVLNFFFPKGFPLLEGPFYPTTKVSFRHQIALGLFCLHMAFQIIMPLRHFAIPNYVSWTEDGHNFAWHMKLRGKHGTATFTIKDPESGKSIAVDSSRYLTKRQEIKMVTRPDLILQFAHFLRDEYTAKGEKPVEVYVETKLRLNGRKPQRLIDPEINLSNITDDTPTLDWVFPMRQPVWNAEKKRNRFGPALIRDEYAERAIQNLSKGNKSAKAKDAREALEESL